MRRGQRAAGGYLKALGRFVCAGALLACSLALAAAVPRPLAVVMTGDWKNPGVGGFGNADSVRASSMAFYDSRLYIGTGNSNGCEVWGLDGDVWSQYAGPAGLIGSGFGDADSEMVASMCAMGGRAYFGTDNPAAGCEVWSSRSCCEWYLAEGATEGGYETWVSAQNPKTTAVDMDVEFQTRTEEAQGPKDSLPARSRKSYRVSDCVTTYDVSTLVHSSTGEVVCERAVHRIPPGSPLRALGTDSAAFPD